MSDSIRIKILEDGTITTETDAISGQNHMSADEFLAMIEKYAGGQVTEKRKEGHAVHTHQHGNFIHSH